MKVEPTRIVVVIWVHTWLQWTSNFESTKLRIFSKNLFLIATYKTYLSDSHFKILQYLICYLLRLSVPFYKLLESTRLFFKIPALFVYLSPFLISISIIQNWKSIVGVLGIWTHGGKMVSVDKTTELWLPPYLQDCLSTFFH